MARSGARSLATMFLSPSTQPDAPSASTGDAAIVPLKTPIASVRVMHALLSFPLDGRISELAGVAVPLVTGTPMWRVMIHRGRETESQEQRMDSRTRRERDGCVSICKRRAELWRQPAARIEPMKLRIW